MKRINVLLVYIALGAVLLIFARFLLPVMGLAGVEGELVQPLVRLTPALLALIAGSVALIAFDLKRQSKLAAKQSKRLVEEAESWSDDFIIGGAIEQPRLKTQIFPDQSFVHQAETQQGHNGYSNGRSSEQLPEPVFAATIENEDWNQAGVAAIAVSNSLGGNGGGNGSGNGPRNGPGNGLDNGKGVRRRVTAGIAGEFSEDRADYGSENKNDIVVEDDVFSRYQHLIESSLSPMSTFHQLPPPLPEFAGRAYELSELYAARADRNVRVLNIQGPGGVGKTTLALKLADQLRPHYPDAQFYLDLKGASAQPLSVAEAQASVVRAYLPTVRLPENEVELDKLYNSALRDKRVLLLLDNAANAQQVAPLVAPDGCITIVTSRNHIALCAMFSQRLECLAPDEARNMLLGIVPRVGEQAGRVAELCGYLPLALRLAASALQITPDQKIVDYVLRLERLQQPDRPVRAGSLALAPARSPMRPPFRPVDAVLSLSYDLLVPGLQKLWRMLAAFRDTFDDDAAASVWKINPARAANALDRLIACSLIERNRSTGRYRMHDLMAQFADAHSSAQERAISRQRFSAHYQSVLHEADALYEQGGEFLKQGLNLVDLEWSNIQAGQVWAATHADEDRAACELCNSYPDAGKYVLDLRQHPRERIRWSEAALTAAQKLNRRKAAVRHLAALGDSYTDLAEVHHAIECYEQALEIARGARDRRGEAEAMSGLGTAYYLGGGLKRAHQLHQEAMSIFATLGDRRGEANSLGNLGLAYFAMGDLRNALMLFDQQLKAAREIGDRRSESQALGGLGMSHYTTGAAKRAADLFNQQLAITREIGDRRGEASALGNLGNAYAALKAHRQAIMFHEQALMVAREIGDRRNEASALGGLGIAEYLEGNLGRSIELLNRQLRLTSEIGDRRGEAVALCNLGEACVAAGDYRTATDSLTKAFNIASQIGDIQAQANALFNLSLALDRTGDRKQAIAQAETALELFQIAEHPYAKVVEKKLAEWRRQQAG
ncbi:MAG: tetratricopeptide repeat protein [Blastocatellales bacterium]